jgi:hypothetical protein
LSLAVSFAPPMDRIGGSGSEKGQYGNHTRFVLNIEGKAALSRQKPAWHENCKEKAKQRFAGCCHVGSIAE